MRLTGDRGGRRPAGAAGATVEAPPEWWWDEFGVRQRDLRVRLLAALGRHGTPWLAESHAAQFVESCRGKFRRPEVAHALRALEADGLVESERRTRPHHHGSPVMAEFVFWRLAPEGARCPP